MGGNRSTRIEYIDTLKVLFILCVLFQHLPEYLGYNPLGLFRIRMLTEQLGGMGVSGFVVLSGFGLAYARLSTGSQDNFVVFWRRRLLRIMPLYYIALVAWLFTVALVPPANLIAHLLFVHVFFRDFSHNPGSLWYVGLIVQCYLSFPLVFWVFHRGQRLLALSVALHAYVLGVAMMSSGAYLSDTVLMYGPEFVLGIELAFYIKNGKSVFYRSKATWSVGALALFVFAAVYQVPEWSRLSMWITWPLTTIGRIGFFLVALSVATRVDSPRLAKLVMFLAFSSYAVFLFHRPFWTLALQSPLWGWIGRLPHIFVAPAQFIYIGLVGIPLIFFVSYWIQIAHDRTFGALHRQHC